MTYGVGICGTHSLHVICIQSLKDIQYEILCIVYFGMKMNVCMYYVICFGVQNECCMYYEICSGVQNVCLSVL